MNDIASPTLQRGADLLRVDSRSLAFRTGAVLLGTIFLALSSYVQVPMVPVPVTMQTFAVTLVGALYGWRLGGITIVAWLIEGALGLPAFASGAGPQYFLGTTGGYLFAFPIAGMLVGWLVGRGWNGRRVGLALLAMALGNALCLLVGAAWLAVLIGAKQAFLLGVMPFIVGALLKSALGAAALKALAGVTERANEA